eukprot:gnl/MRDRNA2_/MRDRNA2_93923_c0_seq1.p1 gnl/MRDRNA2_/MRDRNA2_93923_c0~~gnl/MRDRNA2_/MRDRNA2_93923_c0_seq1.p1  ORF type:complete len:156 (+),score=50.90 gnl/MRDRNA2_/MRDRNA2_93923_c0_seq1:247-714(+)
MKPDWDKLGATYKGSPNLVIADVDCTKEDSQELCQRMDVKGYPTIKSFTPDGPKEGKKYEKGRDLSSLKQFCKKKLKGKEVKCDVFTKSGCTEEEVSLLATLEGKSLEALKSDLDAVNKKLEGVLKTDARKSAESTQSILKKYVKALEKKQKGEL